MTAVRSLRSVRLAVAVLAAVGAMAFCGPDGRPSRELSPAEVSSIHEARLRKLHLVRPDLIHFPISFDAVC